MKNFQMIQQLLGEKKNTRRGQTNNWLMDECNIFIIPFTINSIKNINQFLYQLKFD